MQEDMQTWDSTKMTGESLNSKKLKELEMEWENTDLKIQLY